MFLTRFRQQSRSEFRKALLPRVNPSLPRRHRRAVARTLAKIALREANNVWDHPFRRSDVHINDKIRREADALVRAEEHLRT